VAAGAPHEVLTGPNLTEVYELPIDVVVDPDTGQVRIVPRPRRRPTRGADLRPSPQEDPR
jgi:iron complex transport system ATP-binding protein